MAPKDCLFELLEKSKSEKHEQDLSDPDKARPGLGLLYSMHRDTKNAESNAGDNKLVSQVITVKVTLLLHSSSSYIHHSQLFTAVTIIMIYERGLTLDLTDV
ncbi:hypothetical protein CIHG_05387 [Coccidioides immitis H538.4]|uniref:Uncharacterized protein n=3 Tax=Coccidioides immitis TaxID=5501 RepID=A0A0J8R9N8_COCIT|nr:hypothetical protein CIRG_02178 [Coccidioides immitis RMSCC 2394]KMU81576.1 hypothetical protein CISG_09308 [Coccidioides immitis RMSCC 3703]KMU88217.1 hypothetical protein CIHG_05387 [Coccidioides immitis H538.4]